MVQPLSSKAEDETPSTRPTRVAARRTPPTPARSAREDSVLARIVANLSIPASELGVEGPERPAAIAAATPVSSGAQRVVAEARAKTERDKQARDKAEEAEAAPAPPPPPSARPPPPRPLPKRRRWPPKGRGREKALAAKEEAEEKKRARANPERIWVQVAGGANEDDLPKAWAATKSKAPSCSPRARAIRRRTARPTAS